MVFIEKILRLRGGCFNVKDNQASLHSYIANTFSFLSFISTSDGLTSTLLWKKIIKLQTSNLQGSIYEAFLIVRLYSIVFQYSWHRTNILLLGYVKGSTSKSNDLQL